MSKLKIDPCFNHQRAIYDLKLDINSENYGWTGFWNSEEKIKHPDCGKCLATMIAEVEKVKDTKEKADVLILKDCYKAVLTVSIPYPINVLKKVLDSYDAKYGDSTEFHGKFGGSGRGGSRVILFYEDSPEKVEERKKQLIDLVEDIGLVGMITETRACEYMHHYINLDDTLKGKVRNPEAFLKALRTVKESLPKGN